MSDEIKIKALPFGSEKITLPNVCDGREIKITNCAFNSIFADGHEIKPGDTVTFTGVYRRRSFKEWITRKPKRLKEWRIK